MANLSHLLGNVYGDDGSAGSATGDDHRDPPPVDEPTDQHDDQHTDQHTDDTPAEDDPAVTDPSGADRPPRHAPDWASDERLDAAFGDWTAGEMPEMERDQREDLTDGPEPAAEPEPAPEAIESAELPPPSAEAERADLAPEPQAEPPTEVVLPPDDDQLAGPTWELSHDDILPSRGGGVLPLLRRR